MSYNEPLTMEVNKGALTFTCEQNPVIPIGICVNGSFASDSLLVFKLKSHEFDTLTNKNLLSKVTSY